MDPNGSNADSGESRKSLLDKKYRRSDLNRHALAGTGF